MGFRLLMAVGLLLALPGYSFAAEDTPLLVQAPTLSKTEIVFAYGGCLWNAPRDGGNARQLTTGGHESGPQFSPDGKFIAFTGEYDGNVDVFVMPADGGDALPWMFRQDKIGPLVGTRTWGGLVGISNYPSLLDGGFVPAPRAASYGLHGEWEVENHGIAPDIEVENEPASIAAGHDPQLERAVQVTLEALKKNPVVIPEHPPYPNYHQN